MSDAPYRTLFVVGCPRSGTTWVQLLLDGSPEVVTAPETQIFAYYLDGFRRQWVEEHDGPNTRLQGRAGLSRLLSDEEFRELCARTARFVLDRIHAGAPEATVVVEKSPRHAVLMPWILDVLPDAWVLHVMRDPRDTAASLLDAGRSWATWAPRNPIDAGRLWKAQVEGARRAAASTDRYREVRYEALRERPAEELAGILEWLELPADPETCRRSVEACELERLKKRGGDGGGEDGLPVPGERSPRGFFGRGSVGGWTRRLSRGQARLVEAVCHDTMVELGYEPELVTGERRLARIVAHDALRRVRGAVDWRLQRLLNRI